MEPIKVFLTVVFIALLSMGMVFAGGEKEPGVTTAGKTVSIRYITQAGDKELPEVVDAFHEKYPNIKITTEAVPGSWDKMNTKLLTTFAAGTAPDLVAAQDEPFPAFALRGVYYNLDPLIQKDKNFPIDDCVYGSLEAWKMNPQTGQMGVGNQFALSWSGGIVVGFVNSTLFKQDGLGMPELKWTWDDFLVAAKKLTKRDAQGRTIQFGFENSNRWYHDLPTFIRSAGGAILDYDSSGKAHSVFDTPEVLDALTFVQDIFQKHKVAPIPVLPKQQGVNFTGGKIGMRATGSWVMGSVRKAAEGLGFDWDMFVWPPIRKGPEFRRTRSTFDGLAITADSKNIDAAWEFLRYATVGEGQMVFAKAGTYQPVLESVIKSKYWANPATPQREEIFSDYATYGAPVMSHIMWPKLVGEMDKIYSLLQTGEITPQEMQKRGHKVLNDMMRAGDELTKQYIEKQKK